MSFPPMFRSLLIVAITSIPARVLRGVPVLYPRHRARHSPAAATAINRLMRRGLLSHTAQGLLLILDGRFTRRDRLTPADARSSTPHVCSIQRGGGPCP